ALASTPLCVGHPVHFEGRHAHRDRTGLARLEEACRYAGLPPISFYPEPLAATLAWLHRAEAGGQGTALTVDFGGGTLGGDHLDQKLFETLLFPALGEGERWRRAGDEREIDTPFPFNRYAPFLLNWSIAYTLNQNQFRAPVMDLMARPEPSARKFRRLYTLITQNLAYETFAALREGKRQLSETASVSIDLPELDLSLTLDRPRFEQLIAPELARFDAAVQEALDRASLPPEAIDVVITTGGSSLIPAVQARLQDRFGDRLVSHDPFASVASGLVLAAAQGLGAAPPR
ncbi:MAG: Hsp70 family protein, partial [Pseudomonadales bacterium]